MTEWSPEAKARYHDEMQRLRGTSTETPSPAMYEERIRLLEAERQQAIDALREADEALRWLYSEGIGRMPMFNQTDEQRVAYANGLLRYIEEALGRVKLGEKP